MTTAATQWDKVFDVWSVLHVLWGALLYFTFYSVSRKLGTKKPELWGVTLSIIGHTMYEIKDICRNIPETEYVSQKIADFLFGKEWARKDAKDPVENSYGDQLSALLGLLVGVYVVQKINVSKMVMATLVVLSLLYTALRITGPPDLPEHTVRYDAGLKDVAIFILVTLVSSVPVVLLIQGWTRRKGVQKKIENIYK